MTETSIKNKNTKALEFLNNKLLEIMKDRCTLASYFLSLLSKITLLEKLSQFKFKKCFSSKTLNDLLINKTVTVTL